MQLKKNSLVIVISILIAGFVSCKKETEIVEGNQAPNYSGVSDVLIENYVNRVFIDLIGREPLDAEMENEVALLKEDTLSKEARERLIIKLQTDTTFIPGDSSYKHAYFNQLYEGAKARILEGASDEEINEVLGPLFFSLQVDSLNGDFAAVEKKRHEINKLKRLLKSGTAYEKDSVDINGFYFSILNNAIYDQINMNTFNLIRASFDNLFFRYPSETEFTIGYDMVENSISGVLFGKPGQNKDDYIKILTQSNEFYEGLVVFSFRTLLARDPNAAESNKLLLELANDKDYHKLIRTIMMTDEYAHFE
jgi:hypothetical protein